MVQESRLDYIARWRQSWDETKQAMDARSSRSWWTERRGGAKHMSEGVGEKRVEAMLQAHRTGKARRNRVTVEENTAAGV